MRSGTELPHYIVIEGPDGVGTTTQRDLLVDRLNQTGLYTIGIREPGQTPIGGIIRGILKNPDLQRSPGTDLDLFTADRRETAEQIIKPHLETVGVIVSDRNWVSTVAYQIYGEQSNLSLKEVKARSRGALGEFFTPDLILVLNAPQEIMAQRRRRRDEGVDYFEAKGPEFMERVSRGYELMATHLGAQVIDATPGVEDVHDQIWQTVQAWEPAEQRLF